MPEDERQPGNFPALFSHVGISARDPLALEEFYTQHFGFHRARVFQPGPEQIVMLRQGHFYLEIFPAGQERPGADPSGTGTDYPSYRHICFSVDDITATLKRLGSDIHITLGPLDLDHFCPGMKAVWVSDPEGNIIELSQGYHDADSSEET